MLLGVVDDGLQVRRESVRDALSLPRRALEHEGQVVFLGLLLVVVVVVVVLLLISVPFSIVSQFGGAPAASSASLRSLAPPAVHSSVVQPADWTRPSFFYENKWKGSKWSGVTSERANARASRPMGRGWVRTHVMLRDVAVPLHRMTSQYAKRHSTRLKPTPCQQWFASRLDADERTRKSKAHVEKKMHQKIEALKAGSKRRIRRKGAHLT